MAEYLNPGAVALEDCILLTDKGEELDIKTYIVQISIFEDIFSNVLSAEMLMADNNNLVGTVPIIGREIVTLRYRVPGFVASMHRSFFVYKVENRNPTSGDRQQIYVLHLMAIEGVLDNVTYVSRKYTGYTDQIAENIFNEYLACPRIWNKTYPFPSGMSTGNTFLTPEWKQQVPAENLNTLQIVGDRPFKSRTTWVVPMWTPMKAMNWLATRSIDGSTNGPNVLFWVTTQGFYFSSIDSLFEAQNIPANRKTYYYGLDEAAIQQIMAEKNLGSTALTGYEKVDAVTIPVFSDFIKSQDYGHLASNMHVLDIATKHYREYVYDYASNFETFKRLEGVRPTFNANQTRSVYSYRTFRPSHARLFNDYEPPKYEQWVAQRTSLMYDYSNLRVEINTFGRCDVQAGEVINFYYPKMAEKGKGSTITDVIDPYLSGAYLVAAVRHIITESKYTMRLELIKESFSSSLV